MQEGTIRYYVGVAIAMLALFALAAPLLLSGSAPAAEFSIADLSDENWSHGINRQDAKRFVLGTTDFPGSVIKEDDFILFPQSGMRQVLSVARDSRWTTVTLREPIAQGDGAPAIARLVWRMR